MTALLNFAARPVLGPQSGPAMPPQHQLVASALPNHLTISRPPSSAAWSAPNGGSTLIEKGSPMGSPANSLLPGAGGPAGWNPTIGRDPRGRARSRDYLKQCACSLLAL